MEITAKTIEVEDYILTASNGRKIRIATQVTLPDGEVIRFIERMSKRDALRNVQFELGRR